MMERTTKGAGGRGGHLKGWDGPKATKPTAAGNFLNEFIFGGQGSALLVKGCSRLISLACLRNESTSTYERTKDARARRHHRIKVMDGQRTHAATKSMATTINHWPTTAGSLNSIT